LAIEKGPTLTRVTRNLAIGFFFTKVVEKLTMGWVCHVVALPLFYSDLKAKKKKKKKKNYGNSNIFHHAKIY
jgi:hypothetical protein